MNRVVFAACLAIALLASGCGRSPMASRQPNAPYAGNAFAKPHAHPSAASAVTSPTAWGGDWVATDGSDAAPAGGVPGCMSHWHLAQEGQQIILDADRNPDGGTMPTYLQFEHATGTLQNGTVTLTGDVLYSPTGPNIGMPAPEKLTYVLKLDAVKGHLVGTRNGEAFWAAPLKAADAATCPQ
jgi:hypothetical protein